jgi:hypothetical protein
VSTGKRGLGSDTVRLVSTGKRGTGSDTVRS